MTMLDGFTLLDFSSMGPGPRCTRLLADYGMRVVKVRPPAGATRMMEPPWYAYSANRGIAQLHVDLRREAGLRLAHRLLAQADAMVESFRPGVAARLGLGYKQVAAVNEAIVYCSVSGYGQHGPYASRPAHDLNWLALGGFLARGSRRADGGPALPGGAVADTAGGYSAAVALLAALVRKSRTAQGCYLDVPVMDGVLRMMQYVIDGHLAGGDGEEPPAGLLTGGAACYDVYQAADGKWLAVAAIEPHFWAALCRALGLEHRLPDQRDPGLQEELRTELAAAFRTRTRDEWITMLGPNACVTPVNSPAEVLQDPHLRSRPLTLEVQAGGRKVRQMAPRLPTPDPPGLAAQPAGPTSPAAADELLRGFGVGDAEISALRSDGTLS
jgi:alpha-methylacyl-CoA racemase